MPRLDINSGKTVAVLMFGVLFGFGIMFWFFSRGHSSSNQKELSGEQPFSPEFRPLMSLDGSVVEVLNTVAIIVAWNPVAGTSGYELSYVRIPFAAQTIFTMLTNLTVNGLELGSTYDFKVRAFTGNGTIPGPYSPEIHYTTDASTPTPSPTATATATATFTPTPRPTATFTPTPTATATVTATIAPTPTVTPSPSPNFTITVTPLVHAPAAGGYSNITVTISPANGFAGQMIVATDGLPPQVGRGSILNPSGSLTVTLGLYSLSSLPDGSYPFTVTAASNSPPLVRTSQATLVKP